MRFLFYRCIGELKRNGKIMKKVYALRSFWWKPYMVYRILIGKGVMYNVGVEAPFKLVGGDVCIHSCRFTEHAIGEN